LALIVCHRGNCSRFVRLVQALLDGPQAPGQGDDGLEAVSRIASSRSITWLACARVIRSTGVSLPYSASHNRPRSPRWPNSAARLSYLN
jgi:hypothetical protein